MMDKVETVEEFYKRKFDWMPDNIRNEIGRFNLFRLEPFAEGKPTNIPYRRGYLYKIRKGIYCIFNQHFFHQFGQLNQFEIFQPNSAHISCLFLFCICKY